jgi:eukaryotic-like serine/threonine-protein kinase
MSSPVPDPERFGPWLLLERVASGGMAEVFLAVPADAPDAPPCALKRLLPSLAGDPELAARLEEEGRLSALLDHRAFAAVRARGTAGGVGFLAYDYLPGKDLRAVQARLAAAGARLPVGLAVHVAAEVADALDHAHRLRGAGGERLWLVHNDVSPANVLVGLDGSVRLIDLGLALAAPAGGGAGRPEDPGVRGKAAYLSPEAAAGRVVDRRADVYALGVVLHEALTAARLFDARGPPPAEARRHPIPPPSSLRPEVPPALDAIVLRALALDPAERPAWAGELRDALAPFAAPGAGPALARLMAELFPPFDSAAASRPLRSG